MAWVDDGEGGIMWMEDYTSDTSDFDYDQFYQDYGDVAPAYDPSTAPTDVDVTQYMQDNPELAQQDSGIVSSIGKFLASAGQSALDKLKAAYTDPKTGGVNWKNVAATAGGLYGLYQNQQRQNQPKTGYQGTVPKYEAVRAQVANTYDPTRRAGSGGQQYFTGAVRYAAPDKAATARADAETEAKALEARNKANPAREPVPAKKLAAGGIAALAQGRYLGGATDGMADKIPARIDGKQEARLSHGEFVIPADVVGHLGNGNSEAGAQRLYSMMDRIRKARTGTAKQGKQINPDKFLPT